MRRLAVGVMWVAFGCGPQVQLEGEDTGTSGATTTISSVSVGDPTPATSAVTTFEPTTVAPDGTADTTGADSTNDDGNDSSTFLIDCDLGAAPPGTKHHCTSIPRGCDLFAQDCPRGEKCNPWANDGGPVWNAVRCVPIAADPAGPGETCSVEGSGVSGIDDCELGAMCFVSEPAALSGTCIALCTGSEAMPQCAGGDRCIIANDGAMPLCLSVCDPLQADCPYGSCDPVEDALLCSPGATAGAGTPGDACSTPYECIETATCAGSGEVPGCFDPSCCTSYCDLFAPVPEATCLGGQTCLPFYPAGTAPIGFDHVGVCGT